MKKTIRHIVLAVIIIPFSAVIGIAQADTTYKADKVIVHEVDMKATQHDLLAKGQNNLPKQKSHKSCA